MIQTWMADVTSLLDEKTYQEYYKRVPDYRKEKADALRFQADKALSIGAWILYENMKKEYGLGEEAVYNLSHSGQYVLCSVDDAGREQIQIGCDIEKIKEPRTSLAKRYFCESEYHLVLEDEDYFYRFWVLKESFMKATRLGMKLGLNTFEIEFDERDCPVLKARPDSIPGQFYFREYQKEGVPYRIAVCSDCDEFADELQMVNF